MQPQTPGDRRKASPIDDRQYRLLVEAVTDYAIYMLDPEGIVISWNAGARRFTGYEAAEILGSHFSRFYLDEDQRSGQPAQALETAERDGRFECESWRVRNDGSRFWANVVIDPIRDTSNRLIGFAKITRDLSERKRSEEMLMRSERQFSLLVQGVTDYAIYMLDPLGQIVSWNAGAERTKGYLADEIVGRHFSLFYSREDQEKGEPQRALETAARDGRFENDGWRIRKDGSRFWANVVVAPLHNDAGVLIGFAKVTRDLTERQQAQHALERANNVLHQTQKMDAVGQLTGGIAHDFNNLLMAILGSLELVRKRLPNDPKITRLIDNAIQGAQRGTELTKRMLAFARQQDLKYESIDLQTLVRNMIDLLQSSLGPSVTIETRFPASLSMIRGDSNQIELALLNLAVNARDAMPQGGALVLSVREESIVAGQGENLSSGQYACLSVTDTGDGMDATTLARAMEPFFTTKGPGQGTGLGLSMVHGTAMQMGGQLILKSRKGNGTTAEIRSAGTVEKRNRQSPGCRTARGWRHALPPDTGGGRRPPGVDEHGGDVGRPRPHRPRSDIRQPGTRNIAAGEADRPGDHGSGHAAHDRHTTR